MEYRTGLVCLLSESLDLDRDRIKISHLIFHLLVQVNLQVLRTKLQTLSHCLGQGYKTFATF